MPTYTLPTGERITTDNELTPEQLGIVAGHVRGTASPTPTIQPPASSFSQNAADMLSSAYHNPLDVLKGAGESLYGMAKGAAESAPTMLQLATGTYPLLHHKEIGEAISKAPETFATMHLPRDLGEATFDLAKSFPITKEAIELGNPHLTPEQTAEGMGKAVGSTAAMTLAPEIPEKFGKFAGKVSDKLAESLFRPPSAAVSENPADLLDYQNRVKAATKLVRENQIVGTKPADIKGAIQENIVKPRADVAAKELEKVPEGYKLETGPTNLMKEELGKRVKDYSVNTEDEGEVSGYPAKKSAFEKRAEDIHKLREDPHIEGLGDAGADREDYQDWVRASQNNLERAKTRYLEAIVNVGKIGGNPVINDSELTHKIYPSQSAGKVWHSLVDNEGNVQMSAEVGPVPKGKNSRSWLEPDKPAENVISAIVRHPEFADRAAINAFKDRIYRIPNLVHPEDMPEVGGITPGGLNSRYQWAKRNGLENVVPFRTDLNELLKYQKQTGESAFAESQIPSKAPSAEAGRETYGIINKALKADPTTEAFGRARSAEGEAIDARQLVNPKSSSFSVPFTKGRVSLPLTGPKSYGSLYSGKLSNILSGIDPNTLRLMMILGNSSSPGPTD